MVEWRLDDIFKRDEVDSVMERIERLAEQIESWRERLSEDISDEDFMKIMGLQEELTNLSSRLGAFATLWQSEKTDDSERNSFMLQVSEFLTGISNRVLFFNIWFKELDEKNASRLMDIDPRYRYMLKSIRKMRPYTLDEEKEQILSIKDLTGEEALTNLYDIFTNRFSWDFDGKTLTQEEMTQYFRDFERDNRKDSYQVVMEKYGKEESVLGELYKNLCNDWKNENIGLRGFSSPISVRNIGNDVPDEAVEALLSSIKKNASLFQEYFKLKFKSLGIEDPKRYDIYAPKEKKDDDYTYDQAKDIVLQTYSSFSERMGEEAKKIFDNEHVHSDISQGKRSGAFCYSVQNDVIPYVLLNFNGKQNDVFTLMHEVGHGIHGILGSKQTRFTFHSTLPLAETASIFGETLLTRKMIDESPDDKKIDLLMDTLDKQYGSIIRQGFFVMFEQEAHKMIAEGATIDQLNDAYMENLKTQFGDTLEIPEYFKHEWKYIPHIYHTPFYCYAYAFGNLLVLSLMKRYDKEGDDFIPKFLKILEYGGSEAPATILKEAGLDITKEDFWEEGFQVIREEIDQLKSYL